MSEGFAVPITEPGSPLVPSRFTILVVDDEAHVFELLADTFQDHYEVLQATEGTMALEVAMARTPDLILLDVMLPGIDGFAVCGYLKSMQQTRHIPIIFLTGEADRDAETLGLQMGASDFVSKPINSAALKARVNNQLNLRRAQDQLLQAAHQKHLDDLVAETERSAEKNRAFSQDLLMKDHFLTHVSHELRAPLTAIYQFVSLMADRIAGATTPQQEVYLARTLDNVEQMKSMVDDLLCAATIRNGHVHLDLHAVVVAEAIEYARGKLIQGASRKAINISVKVGNPMSAAYADPARLRQILLILLENAVKFTPRAGNVTVATSTFKDEPGFLLIEVSDTGCGIDQEASQQIFGRLYQTDSSDQGRMGLGLGLHIAKELVQLQGGRIWLESTLGHGTTFRLILPVFDGQKESMPLPDEFEP